MDEVGVIIGPSGVKCIFILLNVFCVDLEMNSETRFFPQSLKLALTGFHLMEFGGVPGGCVGEGDGLGFGGGEFIEAGGEGVVVVGDQFRGVIRWWWRGSGQFGGEEG